MPRNFVPIVFPEEFEITTPFHPQRSGWYPRWENPRRGADQIAHYVDGGAEQSYCSLAPIWQLREFEPGEALVTSRAARQLATETVRQCGRCADSLTAAGKGHLVLHDR